MIFVTVGTTHFDGLVQAIDNLASSAALEDRVLYQIGAGKYEPKNGMYFRFKPSIDAEISDADLVITHGGATVFKLISLSKPFVAVANSNLDGNHQAHFLRFLEEHVAIVWTEDLTKIEECIQRARVLAPPKLEAPALGDDIGSYLWRKI